MKRGNPALFWAKVNKGPNDSCWLWTGSKHRQGYGWVSFGGKTGLAHRVAWTLAHGTTLSRKDVLCHRCDNPPCVNPAHIFIGTQKDNMSDAWAKGRLKPPIVKRGAAHYRAKLTASQVRAIRKKYAAGGITLSALASEYAVTMGAIHLITSRRNWKHI